MTSASIIANAPLSELIRKIETSFTADRDVSATALAFVRDGVITGEGPTTSGRVHFSRRDFAAAIPHLEQALRIDPRHVPARKLLATCQAGAAGRPVDEGAGAEAHDHQGHAHTH